MLPRFVNRVRTRLWIVFLVLLCAAIALAAIGWQAMREAQTTLQGFQGEVLPDVAQALEMAQRAAKLAAVAPNVAESRTAEALEANALVVNALIGEIRTRVDGLQPDSNLRPVLTRLTSEVGRDLENLIELTRQHQITLARLKRQIHALDNIGTEMEQGGGLRVLGQPTVAALWTALVMGATAEDAATLGRLEADVEALLAAVGRRGLLAGMNPRIADALLDVSVGSESILSQRRNQLELERHTAYLVVLTRANVDQLSTEVEQHVTQLRDAASSRSARVQRAIHSGETGMLVLALGCLAIAGLAMRYVHRFVGQIEHITAVMSRLAQGNTAQQTPATQRRDELGALARSFEVFRDALVAKQVLVADLARQGDLLEAVYQSMTDGLAVFDRRGALRLWNQRLAGWLQRYGVAPYSGLTARELKQRLPAGTTWSVPGQIEAQPMATALRQDFGRFEHVELNLPDGQVYDQRSRSMPDGGSVMLVTDVTARRLAEIQLQQAQRLELLGQLTGGVAHDFNNYLGTIIGNLSMLESQPGLDPEGQGRLARAQRAAVRAAALTRRLLAFSRRQPLEAEAVEVDEMIEAMHDLIEYSAGVQTRVELELGCEGRQLFIDRGHLENAVLNLVLNSAAAMPAGGTLRVGTRALATDTGEQVEISVADTGAGIPEHLQARVFEPFFTTKAVGEGSGLGLSIVYGFVKQSGGDVMLSSRPGEGTTVSLRFPLMSRGVRRGPSTGTVRQGTAAMLAGRRILVVDDDEAFRVTVVDMLRDMGAEVVELADAASALVRLDQEAGCSVDLVLTDVCLGRDMDGIQLARRIRQRHPGLALCLMSGLSVEVLSQRGDWDAGLVLLPKPFDRGTLGARLADLPGLPARSSDGAGGSPPGRLHA